ncbi:hypothetical protein CU098_000520, partial [Rhizopus stolonifer]
MSKLLKSPSGTDLKQKRPISFAGMTANQVKLELTAQLNNKEKVLEKANASPISKNALTKQTDRIRKEILSLDQYKHGDPLPTDIRSKLENLANEFQDMKGMKSAGVDDAIPRGPSASFSPLLPPPPTNSSPTKRTKTVNGNRRNPDIEFATEIGQGLLIEVRKLQTALQEKEEIIKQLEMSQADTERSQESAERYLKQREETEERLKEENWNLEVTNQELRASLLETNQALAKHNTEYSKLAKQLKSQSEQIDIMKAQEEKSASVIEAMKARHEQETYQIRKHAATAQRENSQIQKQMEALNTELKICKAKLAIKMATINRVEETHAQDTANDANKDQDTESDQANANTPVLTASTSQSNRTQVLEAETLKQSLAHAHRIISNLRSSLHKEKLEKFEVKKMLSDSQENIEQMRKEMASWNNNALAIGGNQNRSKSGGKRKATAAKKKRGGVGRQPRGLVANDSDAELKSSSANEETEDEELSNEETHDEDSVDEDALDPEFAFVPSGNTLGSFMEFNNAPFGSSSMKPLSSELEADNKVQVIDIGVNTEPIELSAISKQDNTTRFDSFVAQTENQEILPENSAINQRTATSGLKANDTFVQEQISQALVKERRAIFERAEPILSAEQIKVILPTQNMQDTQDTIHTTEKEFTHAMIPKSDVDKLIQEAIDSMLPKSEAEAMVTKATEETRSIVEKELSEQMILRTQFDAMLHEATQKTRAELKEAEEQMLRDMVTKANAESMVQEAVVSTTEKLTAEFDDQKKKMQEETLRTMVTKVKAESMVQEATQKLRAEFDQENKKREEQERIKLSNIAAETKAKDMISKQDAEKLAQKAAFDERDKAQAEMNQALEKQKAELESAKQVELERLEANRVTDLESQKLEMQTVQKTELEKFAMEMDAMKEAELEEQKREFEMAQKVELETQRLEIMSMIETALEKQKVDIEATMQAELDKQKNEIEAAKLSELQKQKAEIEQAKDNELEKQKIELEAIRLRELEQKVAEMETTKKTEIEALSKRIESYKKEQEENNQRMKNMLTKESVDVLVKRAVAGVQEAAEKSQAEALAGMISREYAKRMVEDEVAKALEAERKEVAQREAAESMEMISKAEAEALAKVAAADAIVKERQAAAVRESELVTKEEVKRNEAAAVLAKERKALKEKEEQTITKEQAEQNTKEAVKQALLDYQKNMSKEPPKTTLSNLASTSETPKPTRFSKSKGPSESVAPASKEELAPPPSSLERSVSTSRLNLPSVNVTPAPSVSTPTNTGRKLRLSSSVSSLRIGSSKKDSQKNARPSTDSTHSFGSFRILDSSKYQSHRLQSKSSISLRELSNKQHSTTSVSTMSSGEDQTPNSSQIHAPMNSDETFSGFPSAGGTDMYVISAITQTMIGEWMSKHTRRYVGGGISEKKHQRYFWVHPYTKILYWSPEKPGAEGNQVKTKSAYIESLSVIPSHDNSGASPVSLLIHTPKRDLKITATSLERHDLWFKSLSYLLGRSKESSYPLAEEPSRLTSDSSSTIENAGHQQGTIHSKASDAQMDIE